MGNLGTKIADESPSGSTRSGKSSHTAHRELHDNLMLTHEHRDPMKYYELIDVLGVGSMGTVAKVKKKDSAVGGSARPSFRKAENRCCYGLPFTCCFAGEGKGKSGLFIAVSEHKLDLLKKSSSLITYGNHKDSYFALKSILLERAADKTFIEELKNEVAILKTLDHPSIVRPLETFSYQNQLYILMELCDGGDLYSRDPYTEMEAARITSSILSAIAYMHSKNITHRDLKYENVMFANKNTDAEVKLIDFGLSAKYGIDETLHGAVGKYELLATHVLRLTGCSMM
jgi:serine/threonine protein kinase